MGCGIEFIATKGAMELLKIKQAQFDDVMTATY